MSLQLWVEILVLGFWVVGWGSGFGVEGSGCREGVGCRVVEYRVGLLGLARRQLRSQVAVQLPVLFVKRIL